MWRKRVPIIYQSERAECGLASVAMIASYFGHRVELATLRDRLKLSARGLTMRDLIWVADELGMASRPVRIELDQVRQLRLPAILHWKFNHFVVLVQAKSDHYFINDPALGERRVSEREFSDNFTGVALELTPNNRFQLADEVTPVRLGDVSGKLSGLRPALIQVVAISLVIQLLALSVPFLVQVVLDRALAAGDLLLLYSVSIASCVLALAYVTVNALRAWVLMHVNSVLDMHFSSNVLRKMLSLPFPFFQRRNVGTLVSRFQNLKELRVSLSQGLSEAVVDGAMALSALAVLLFAQPKIFAVAAMVAVGYFGWRSVRSAVDRGAMRKAMSLLGRQHLIFLESLLAIETIKAFAVEDVREGVWANSHSEYLDASADQESLAIANVAFRQLLFFSGYLAAALVGALEVIDSTQSLGMLLAEMFLLSLFFTRAQNFVDKVFDFRIVKVHLELLGDVVHGTAEIGYADELSPVRRLDGLIEIRNVSFKHSRNDPYIFEGLSIRVEAGQSVAIIGRSGCGKSTLIRLLLGLLEPEHGEILYDGLPIASIGRRNVRRRIGCVLQSDHLFYGTVKENITLFDPQPDTDQLATCMERAFCDEFVRKMPMQDSTLISDTTALLSGGERQRILLARALYTSPSILLLDEASSHLDDESEARINESLRHLRISRLFVAHRESTIAMAERVIDLTKLRSASPMAGH